MRRWKKRYLLTPHGSVWLARGRAKKKQGDIWVMVRMSPGGKWLWYSMSPRDALIPSLNELVRLRLEGRKIGRIPEWTP